MNQSAEETEGETMDTYCCWSLKTFLFIIYLFIIKTLTHLMIS